MSINGLPSIYQTRSFQSAVAEIRTRVLSVQQEATTGEIADLSKSLRGDVGRVQKLEKGIADNQRYLEAISQAATRFSVVQSTLGSLQETGNLLGIEALGLVQLNDRTALEQQTISARNDFIAMVSSLNGSVGNRMLFSGAAVDTVPIQSAEQVLTDIDTIVQAAPDAATAQTNIDAYFAAGGAFETTIYQGSTTAAPTAEVSPGRRVAPDVTVIDPEIKQVLQAFATIAVSFDAPGGEPMSNTLIEDASQNLVDGAGSLIDIRARLGAVEEELDTLRTRNEAETFALERALAALITRDQFDASVELQALTSQLEAIFVTTSRIANLSLTNYLR